MKEEAGRRFLRQHGFPLYAALACETLPPPVRTALAAAGIVLERWSHLILTGSAGDTFWPALQQFGMHTADPVDHYSRTIAGRFAREYLDDPPLCWLYPLEDVLLPLQQLGYAAGWCHPSPLGLDIHPEYGPWFAYRTAFLTTAPVEALPTPVRPSPCDTCRDRPCIAACPAGAVRGVGRFAVGACGAFRLAVESPCAERCLSRLACPVGAAQRYPEEQLRYHYRDSLQTLRRFAGADVDGV